jgi:hypothetical protein
VVTLEGSDSELRKIETELSKFPLSQDDLRYDFFKFIIDIMQDDI